jgi:hypothetical protein
VLAEEGQIERAVELHSLVTRYPRVGNSRFFEDVAGQYVRAAAKSLPPEVVAAAKTRGRARDRIETVKELLAWLEEEIAVEADRVG